MNVQDRIVDLERRLAESGVMVAPAVESVAVNRAALVAETERIRGGQKTELATLLPKLKAAEARKDKATKELLSASQSWQALRRKVAALSDSTGRRLSALERELTESADPRIGQFVESCRERERELLNRITTEHRDTGRFLRFGNERRLVSNKPAIDRHVEALQQARATAEKLKLQHVEDVAAELARLDSTIPAGELEFTPVDNVTTEG